MVRGGKKQLDNAAAEANPEAEERKRRKRLACSKGILSEAPAKAFPALSPSKTVTKHHGRDILRKSQRKNRFLFSFPGLLAPISGGKIGELKDLGTKNPVLYLDFPQGQMKMFGTIVYPKNRYLTLQFSRGGKNVMCEDYFNTMIVFSDAWWIGRKDDNPEEARLEFPMEPHEAHHAEYDFKGGAGAASEMKQEVNKSGLKYVEQESPKTELEDDSSDSHNKLDDLVEVTPIRHSERTAGKRFHFAESSSGDDFAGNDIATSVGEDKKGGAELLTNDYAPAKLENSYPVVFDIDNEDAAEDTHFSGQVQQSSISMKKFKEISHSNNSSLVQPTISSLFKKVEEKKAPRKLRKSSSSKASSQNMQHVGSEIKTNKEKDKGPRKKGKVIEDRITGSENVADKQPENLNSVEPVKVYQRKTKTFIRSTSTTPVKGQISGVCASKLAVPIASSEVEDDDIEELSSTSKDSDGSDEDWAG